MGFDVVCVGEAVLDLVAQAPGRLREARSFAVRSGGAPCNVAVGAAREGARVAFIGVAGGDEFGQLLRARLGEEGVDTTGLRHDPARRTDLCFIAVDPAGERSFFYPAPTGDRPALRPDDVTSEILAGARVVHFGGGMLESADGVAAAERLVDLARAEGALVAFDPNPRVHRWADHDLLRARLAAVVPRCDVVKCSVEEAPWISGTDDPWAAAASLVSRGVSLAVVTLGSRGAIWARAGDRGAVPAPAVPVVDTTGAGDAFQAALVARLAADPAGERLHDHLAHACARGSEACTRLGAT